MAHVPHLLVDRDWDTGGVLTVHERHRRHLGTVLRRSPGDPVTYTDGAGTIGTGEWTGESILRGEERTVAPPSPKLTVAVAPPDAKDRVRWLVEKATELGVWRIRWLRTAYGQGRIPKDDRAAAWMTGALEQSRGAWITRIDTTWSVLDELSHPWIAADSGGDRAVFTEDVTVAIGPEGGWAPDELAPSVPRLDLGPRVLRTETAVVAVAALSAIAHGGSPTG